MELKQFQYFRAVAKHNSISLAAEALYITQPALSRCIQRLEEEVGVKLLVRQNNGVHLTEAGAAFLQELDQAFLHVEQGLLNARTIAQQESPRISIVYSFEEFDTGVVYQLHQAFPDVQTSLDILPPDKAYRELLAGNADFAVIPRRDHRPGFAYQHLLSEEMLLSAAPGHPLHGRQYVTLSELYGQEIVCNEVAFDWDSIQKICVKNGIQLKLLASSNDHQTVGKFREITESMIFIPMGALAYWEKDGRDLVPPARVVPQVFRRDAFVVYSEAKKLSVAEKYFLELLQSAYRKKQHTIQQYALKHYS